MSRVEEQAAADAENEAIGSTTYNMPSELEDATTYYSEPHFPTRELPPIPIANHTNTDTDSTDVKISDGMTDNEPQINPEISSNVSPSSAVAASYSGLQSSTREPAEAPVVYDRLVKPVYYNINFLTSDVRNGTIGDEQLTDSGFSLHRPSTSSETETTMI